MKKLKLKTWQWVFVGFLAIMTIWSIYAELTMHEDHGTPHEQGEVQEAHQPEQETEHEEVAAAHEKEQEHQGGHWQSGIPFFWIGFGFFGCIALIVFAKNLLALVIYKKEDYYNE
jgi:ABC-type Zn2+ transport system substrate-binding protein/surface adhesin